MRRWTCEPAIIAPSVTDEFKKQKSIEEKLFSKKPLEKFAKEQKKGLTCRKDMGSTLYS